MNLKEVKEFLIFNNLFRESYFDSEKYKIDCFNEETTHILYVYEAALGTSLLKGLNNSVQLQTIVNNLKIFREKEVMTTSFFNINDITDFIIVLSNEDSSVIIGAYTGGNVG